MKMRKPTAELVLYCWENGPRTDDDMSTSCMLVRDHIGPHEWTRDNDRRTDRCLLTERHGLRAKSLR